ncbi:oligopeptide ABC transporter substrate-binding protein OppA [Pectobacterium brasiliense]|uniref:ABC transporter substrate-binding protein n=1 Tax=Pectobacterium brasiliense TaxID=180957 RepID=UPI00094A1F70|nr:ABC transporter substrate-binding protein [Pectobacterium brasiliense]APS30389.1 peptide ABC transporter substrate-binding protein [Pectobacterium brasiliense]MBN3098284.1 oligopeptide ABC transporter substrate-binding protein OppA [Pectobacterium brasiliense]MBN3101001.1 oligopeptide ABC transporter substrate-binding protein OppA [Pectobacterium brasiliense]MBN3167311.1 oligopeptide ABC transporter substrate-binding protein OppA [Pectobacterium brasiliense]
MNELIKKRFKHSLLFLTLCATGAMTSAFAAQVPAGVELADKQELVRGNGSEPASLDPHKVESDVEGHIINDFFDNLVRVGDDGTIQPRLAERWDNKDNTVWTFHLRPDAKWSDGSPITADDVVYSWRRLSDPKTLSPYGTYVASMYVKNAADILAGKKAPDSLGVKALDSHTVEVTLEHPLSYFLEMSAYHILVPLPKAVLEKHPDNWTQVGNFVSSGPYTLSEWVVNERIVGKRNSQYWDNVHTVINKVTYLPISSQAAELNRYKSGEIDVTGILSPVQFASLKKEYPQEVKVSPLLSTYFYQFNTQKPPFDDARVRRALDLSLDKTVIAQKVMGMGQKPAYSLIPQNTGGYIRQEPEWASWTQEQRNAEAKKLLEEAGFNAKNPLRFNLLYNTSESHLRVAIAANSMWKKNLGVEATLQNQEWKTMLDTIRSGNYEVVRYSWNGDYNEPSTFLEILQSGNSNNNSKFRNAEYDALLQKALTVDSRQERQGIYQQATTILNQQMPLLPIYYYVQPQMVKPYIGGFLPDIRGNYYTQDIYVIKH